MERITLNLTKAASQAMTRARDITEESKTDSVNHALLLYAIICEAMAKGGTVYIQPDSDSPLECIIII